MTIETKPDAVERERIHAYTTDYRKREGSRRGTLVDRGFWIHHLPRLILNCRLLGHKAVVDGTEGYANGTFSRPGYRWVCCDRCGLRPRPQGDLDPVQWDVGDRYRAPLPGPWPRATGSFGGQIVIGRSFPGASIGVAVGSAGDDHGLAVHVRLNPIGALYLHVDEFGTWIQRRLNPTGYDTRTTELTLGDGRLSWRLWAKRDEHSGATPRWRDGSTVIDPRERLFGPVLGSYEKVGEPVTATIRMPEGDDHEVILTLERKRIGRRRGEGKLSWAVDWASEKGIPFRHDSWKGNEVMASGVSVSDAAVKQGRWAAEACAAIAADVSEMRTRYRWRSVADEVEI
jgi:hypothetical protein